MATASFTWACLLLAATAGGADDVVPMNVRSFRIPIKVLPQRQADLHHLLLYISRDQGKTWAEYANAGPEKRDFAFTAPEDGLYWFSVATVDNRNVQEPRDVRAVPPGQKVLVDTTKPDVHITALDRQGDEVRVAWTASDLNPDWTSLKLEYRVGDSATGQWVPLAIDPGPSGNKTFRPALSGDLVVRLVLKDTAGNEGVAERRAAGFPGVLDRDHGVVTASGSDAPPPAPVEPGPAAKPAPGGSTVGLPSGGPAPERMSTVKPSEPSPPPEAKHHDTPPAVAESNASVAPAAGSGDPPMPTRLARLPELRIVNKRQVKLDFEVSKFGPSGLGSVDVYVTTNEGASWELLPGDHNVSLPPMSEARGSQTPVHGSVTVQLADEGVAYGFYLVVKSRAGLGKPAPHAGTAPHIRLEVDTTQPVAKLFAPRPSKDQRDALELTWSAEDKNLETTNPISLEWAPNRDGPWSPIGSAQMPNTGRYVWQIPPQTPPKVYLKLTARDVAGNVAVAQTTEPVLIDLQEPELGNVTFSTP